MNSRDNSNTRTLLPLYYHCVSVYSILSALSISLCFTEDSRMHLQSQKSGEILNQIHGAETLFVRATPCNKHGVLKSRKFLARYFEPDQKTFYRVVEESTGSRETRVVPSNGKSFPICLSDCLILRFYSEAELQTFKDKKVHAKFDNFYAFCVLF